MTSLVSKGAFAQMTNVTPTRVGQWIREGKLTGEALHGEGRFAKIRVAVALEQLGRKLDMSQRLGNGLSTRLDAPRFDLDAPRQADANPPRDSVEDEFKRERLRALRLSNEREAEKRLAEQGRYVLADQAQAGMARVASLMLNVFEGSLSEIAAVVAAKTNASPRDVLHLVRTEFRTVRERTATALRSQAAELAPVIEDMMADVSDPAQGRA
jgi:hypothetical protein